MLFIGPFPPPTHGQSAATARVAQILMNSGLKLKVVDVSQGPRSGVAAALHRIAMHAKAGFACMFGNGTIYISANSNKGMWLTTMLAGMGRIRRRPLFIHHHAYDHVRRRRSSMVWLARVSGPSATHVVLGETMARELSRLTPEAKKTFVLNNSGLVDLHLLELVAENKDIVLGHLSNLTLDKGVDQAVHLAVEASRAGLLDKFILAGPIMDSVAQHAVKRAQEELGDRFEFRGAIYGADKLKFFQDINCFVFPTRYRNEASPLVLLEAMAAGVTCVAYGLACIPDDIGDMGGLLVPPESDFTDIALPYLARLKVSGDRPSRSARDQFEHLLRENVAQMQKFRELLSDTSGPE